jgi:DNA-directed RNA polymerase subunit alpha
LNPILLHVVDELEISPNLVAVLKRENIYYIGDLVWRTEAALLQRPSISSEMVVELREALRALGLDLGEL